MLGENYSAETSVAAVTSFMSEHKGIFVLFFSFTGTKIILTQHFDGYFNIAGKCPHWYEQQCIATKHAKIKDYIIADIS